MIPEEKVKEMLEKDVDTSKPITLRDLLLTSFFASPNPLQLVVKYVPNLSKLDPDKLNRMTMDFEQMREDMKSTDFSIKELSGQYWLLKKKHNT